MRYRAELRAAVLRAKASPGALLKGYDVCMDTHVQPPSRTLSAVVRSAGGNVSSLSLNFELIKHALDCGADFISFCIIIKL